MAGSIIIRLEAYNSATKDNLVIGYYNRLDGTWEPNIAGNIIFAFLEEPDDSIKIWLQSNAIQQ